jgi:Caspase domain
MAAQQLKDYALVVSIGKYADSGFLQQLDGPVNDARCFVEWLVSDKGGSLPAANVDPYRLESDATAQKPKTGDVIEAVRSLLALAPGDERIGRRLYIFLAGHGVGPDLDDAGLLTVEATEDMPSYLEGRRYANLFRGRAAFDEVILMMDCCRDYDGDLPEGSFPFKKKVDAHGASKVKRFYAYATGFGKAARERDFGGQVKGVFSHVLLEGLNGGAIDGDGCITGTSLERYVRKKLKSALPPGVDQPTDIRTDPGIIFAEGLPPASAKGKIRPTVAHHRLMVLHGNGLKPLPQVPKMQPEGHYAVDLPVGKMYVFQLLDAAGVVLTQAGRTVEDAEEVISVDL